METQKNEIVKLDMAQYGLEENKATQIENLYLPMIKLLVGIESEYNDIVKQKITPEISMRARTLRLKIVPYRTKADDVRKTAKAESLRANNAIQGAYNTFEWVTKSKEEKLMDIEKHLEKIEAERKIKLKEERETALAKYEVETEHIQLSEMSDEVWENYFNGVKSNYENVKAAERKTEADHIAKEKVTKLHNDRKDLILNLWQFVEPELKTANLGEIDNSAWSNIVKSLNQEKIDYDDKQKEIKKENERLQKETEAKEKQIQAERAEAEKERKNIEEKARKERETAEAKSQKEAEEKAKLEKELQARKDKEIQAEKVKQEAIENELSKGDNDKFQSLLNDLKALKTKHVFKSKKYQKKQQQVSELIDKIINFTN